MNILIKYGLNRIGWGWMLVAMVYGEPWRERRRMFQKYFHSKNTQLYQPIQIEFIRKMLPRLLEKPEEIFSISRQYVNSLNLSCRF